MKNFERSYEFGPEQDIETYSHPVTVYDRLTQMRECMDASNSKPLNLLAETDGKMYEVSVGMTDNDEFDTVYFKIAEIEEGIPKGVANFYFADNGGVLQQFDHEVGTFQPLDSEKRIAHCHGILSRAKSPVGAI